MWRGCGGLLLFMCCHSACVNVTLNPFPGLCGVAGKDTKGGGRPAGCDARARRLVNAPSPTPDRVNDFPPRPPSSQLSSSLLSIVMACCRTFVFHTEQHCALPYLCIHLHLHILHGQTCAFFTCLVLAGRSLASR